MSPDNGPKPDTVRRVRRVVRRVPRPDQAGQTPDDVPENRQPVAANPEARPRRGLSWFVNNYVNWRYIRGAGELQVLTRASYLMLILVPLAAGIWPTFRATVHSYNVQGERAAAAIAAISNLLSAERGASHAQGPAHPEPIAAVSANGFHPLEETGMPMLLTLSFLASLAVLFGQLFYQLTVPERIREKRYLERISEKREEWRQAQSLAYRKDAEEKVIAAYNQGIDWNEITQAYERLPMLNPATATNDDDELAVIEGAAAAEYALLGMKAPLVRIAVATLYGTAILIILALLIEQSSKVIEVTEWQWPW